MTHRPAHVPRLPGLPTAELLPGSVALVGGGPGAWDLITVRGLVLLQQADAVVVDRLGPTDLIDTLQEGVEVVPVGKTPGAPSIRQEEIQEILVRLAREGKRVVRLKGGDPFVLGRGGEEILACRTAGIPVQVVPGISSAIAGPGAAGIPVTHRGATVAVHVVNAHGDLGPADLAALRDPATTTVMLMGVEWLPRLVRQALLNGVDPLLPVAVVHAATTAQQRTVRAPLQEIAAAVEREQITFPSIIVAGATAAEGFLDPSHLEDDAETTSARPASPRGAGRDQLTVGRTDLPAAPLASQDPVGADAPRPVLIACAHGTRSRQGRDVLRSLLARLSRLTPVTVREAFVDVQEPTVARAVAEVCTRSQVLRTREADHVEAVVVPLLLSTGYHVRDDIGGAVAAHCAVAAEPLGPDLRLAQIMHERLREAGYREGDAVVMAASGTRVADGVDMVEQAADLLRKELSCPVTVGYAYAAHPSLEEAVEQARERAQDGSGGSGRVAVASYMLTPGHFSRLVEKAGADVVAAPLGDHPLLAELILDRYLAAVGA